MEEKKNNYLGYLAGGILGAVVGILTAYLLQNNQQFENKESRFSKKKLSRIGLGTISMLWSLIDKGK